MHLSYLSIFITWIFLQPFVDPSISSEYENKVLQHFPF